jgi:RNA polymerase sigma-70 factor, ECF subfamily
MLVSVSPHSASCIMFLVGRPSSAEITVLLKAWTGGDAAALDKLIPLVYGELRRIARNYMRKEGPGNTLQTTALVHEAFVRLVGGPEVSWQDRAHFFAVSAQLMRRILVDAARARGAGKRGGAPGKINLDESIDALPQRGSELIALDEALSALAQFDSRKASGGNAVLRRSERGRDGRSPQNFAPERDARLETGARLAAA